MVGKKPLKNKKKMTLDGLVAIVGRGFVDTNKATDERIDGLAVMVQTGFSEVYEVVDKGFKKVHEKMDKGFKKVDEELEVIDGRLNTIDRRLDSLAQDHSDRLNHLEKRVGIT